jgi:hypothetical protein
MKNMPINSIDDVVKHAYSWNERKRHFTPRQIALAAEVLSYKDWTNALHG